MAQAGVGFTEASSPHTLYEPGAAPPGGAVRGVELVQVVPAPEGAGPVAQLVVLPKDQDTWL